MSKKNEETKSVVVASPAGAPALADNIWGAADNIGAEDLQVSKIFHQQALSKFVQDGKAQAGDWCDSLTGEVLAKKDTELTVIVFSSFKKLLISKALTGSTKFDFIESQDVTPENCNLPWEEEVFGEIIKRQLQYNYFCLLPSKINELPYVLSLSSTKIKAAKKLNTMIAKLSRLGKPSAAFTFLLHSVKETGDKGSWFGMDISSGRQTTPEELEVAHYWYMQIKSQKVTITEEPEDNAHASNEQ